MCAHNAGNSQASTRGQLEEPLLTSEDRSEDHDSAVREPGNDKARGQSYRSQERTDRALVPHSINRINWEELWRLLWGNCCSSWAGIVGMELDTAPCMLNHHTLDSLLLRAKN